MKKSQYVLLALVFLLVSICFQLAGCNGSREKDALAEDTADIEETGTKETGNDAAEDGQEKADDTGEESPATSEEMKLPEGPDTEKFDEYFSNIGLGKLAADATLLQDMEPDISIFSTDERICIYGTLKKSAIIGVAIYNPETSSYASKRQDLPQTLEKGNFSSCSGLTTGSGKYEYRVYIGDTLVAALPFEVK